MITYMPTIYPGETIYSLLSRTYEKCGYLSYAQAKKEFFVNPTESLEFLFLNKLRDGIIEIITQNQSLDSVIKKHTLYNYYGRYLGKQKRREAYNALINMTGDYFKIFRLSRKTSEESYLRYCPICAKEDKKNYGETYWKRTHQIPELEVCSIHGCKLLKSNVSSNKHNASAFVSADTAIEDFSVTYGSDQEIILAKYVYTLLQEDIKYDDDLLIGKYLISKMEGTKYLSSCGKSLNRKILFQDLKKCYGDGRHIIQEESHLSKIFHGKRTKPFEIIQIAILLNISCEELVNACNPETTPAEKFEEIVLSMLQENTAKEVSHILNVSESAIKTITQKQNGLDNSDTKYQIQECRKIWIDTIEKFSNCSFSYICNHSEHRLKLQWLRRNDKEWTDTHYPRKKKVNNKQKSIDMLDKEYLPQIEEIINEYRFSSGGMPNRITVSAINNYIGLPGKQLYCMKQCRSVIEKHTETNEEFRVRKILWAIDIIKKGDKPLTFHQINKLTHIHIQDYYKCRSILVNKIGEDSVRKIDPNSTVKI